MNKNVKSTLESIRVKNGFYRFSTTSTTAYPCPWPTCPGGIINPNATVTESLCSEGAGGKLCSVCDKGYFMDPHGV